MIARIKCLIFGHDPEPTWPIFSVPLIECKRCPKQRKSGRWA